MPDRLTPRNKIYSIYHGKVTHRKEKTEFSHKGRVEFFSLFQIAGTLCTNLRGRKKKEKKKKVSWVEEIQVDTSCLKQGEEY